MGKEEVPVMKVVRVFPFYEAIEINEDGTSTEMLRCLDPVHIFESIPGHCQCGAQYWVYRSDEIEMY